MTLARLYRVLDRPMTHKELMFALNVPYDKLYWRIMADAERKELVVVERGNGYPYYVKRNEK